MIAIPVKVLLMMAMLIVIKNSMIIRLITVVISTDINDENDGEDEEDISIDNDSDKGNIYKNRGSHCQK